MTLFNFACKNISRDKRNYLYYFVNCAFSVFVFFLFTVLSFHPAMSIIDTQSTMGMILALGQTISIVFSICFISYSMKCFLRARSRQFGLITILGASKKQLNQLIFIENILVGFLSIITGIVLGLVFSKFFLDIANSLIGVSDFIFYFPIQAMIITILIMGILFLGISFLTPKFIRRTEVVKLLKTEVTGEKPQNLFPALIIFLIFAFGLVWVFTSETKLAASIQENFFFSFSIAIPVVLGTYLLFANGMRLQLTFQKISASNVHLLYSTDRRAKLKANTQSMTISAILYSISFFSVIILFSMSSNVKVETEKIIPYAMSYNAWTENADTAHDIAIIEKELHNLSGYQKTDINLWYDDMNFRTPIMSLQEYNNVMKFLGKDIISLTYNGIYLVSGHADQAYTAIPNNIQAFLQANGLSLSVEGYSTAVITLTGFTNGICVVNDSVFNQFLSQLTRKTIVAFDYDNWEANSESSTSIKAALKDTLENRDANVVSAYDYYHSSQIQNNFTLYIAGMLCFVFILAVASFIYSRLYSELDTECKKYKGIVKIGLSKKELSIILNKLTFLILWVPFFIALVYLWIGILISEQFVLISNIPAAFWFTVILLILQTVLYECINTSYRKTVFRKVYGN